MRNWGKTQGTSQKNTHPCSQSFNNMREPVLPRRHVFLKPFSFMLKCSFWVSVRYCFISGAIRLDLLHLNRWSILGTVVSERERELSKYHTSSGEYVVWTLPKTNKAKKKGSFWVLLTLDSWQSGAGKNWTANQHDVQHEVHPDGWFMNRQNTVLLYHHWVIHHMITTGRTVQVCEL